MSSKAVNDFNVTGQSAQPHHYDEFAIPKGQPVQAEKQSIQISQRDGWKLWLILKIVNLLRDFQIWVNVTRAKVRDSFWIDLQVTVFDLGAASVRPLRLVRAKVQAWPSWAKDVMFIMSYLLAVSLLAVKFSNS